jgi:hypothetical protein
MFGALKSLPHGWGLNVVLFGQLFIHQGAMGRGVDTPSFFINDAQYGCMTSDTTAKIPKKEEGIRYLLNTSGSRYIQITFLNQVWLRRNQNNPGTTVEGLPQDVSNDIGLRRTRIQLLAQLTERVFFYMQFGQNTVNSQFAIGGNRKQAAFVHDAVCEYRIGQGNRLKLGSGLTIINGLSRFSQPSIGSILSLDVPVFAQATVDQTDEFSRKLSVYARGQLGRIDYRIVLSDPFPVSSSGGYPSPPYKPDSLFAAFSPVGHHSQSQVYVIYQFGEHETHTTPYMSGTRLGQKRICHLAGGIIHQKNAMWMGSGAEQRFQPMFLWAVEGYLDIPLNRERGSALNAYLGYFDTNYGTRYLRYNGIMNPANGQNPAFVPGTGRQGPSWGNALPMMGTGHTVYAQLGYLLPQSRFSQPQKVMPYATMTYSDFDALDGLPMNTWNAGCNYFLQGHQAKLTLDWLSRPTYLPVISTNPVTAGLKAGPRKSTITLQYQIFF